MKFTAKTIMSTLVFLLWSNSVLAAESDDWADWASTTSTTLALALASVSDDVDELSAETEDAFFDSVVRVEEDLVALDVVDDAILDFQDKFSLSDGELELTALPDVLPDALSEELPEELPNIGDLLPSVK